MTIYDIAGEAFTSFSSSMQQQQFQYCEGIVFVVDSTANPTDVCRNSFELYQRVYRFEGKKFCKNFRRASGRDYFESRSLQT